LRPEHLIRLGHERIAFNRRGRSASPARDRATAYRETLARYGLAIGRGELPANPRGRRTRHRYAAAGEADRPDRRALLQRHLRLRRASGPGRPRLVAGRDCAVIGFDNIAEAALYRPALTTIAIDARRIGEEAASLLLRRIKSQKAAPESIILPPSLIVRSSLAEARPHITSREIPPPFSTTCGTKRRKDR